MNAKERLIDNIEMIRWFLTTIGAWPKYFCQSWKEKFSMLILNGISCTLIAFLLIHAFLATILNRDDKITDKVLIIGPLSFFVMAAANIYILLSRGDQITRCILHMKEDVESMGESNLLNEERILIENAELGRSLAKFCAWFMYIGVIFYTTITPLIAKKTEIFHNVTVRSVSFPIYRSFMNPQDSPYYEIFLFIQCMGGYVICTVTIASCSLVAVFVTHACGQLKIVMSRLKSIVDGFPDEESRDTVKYYEINTQKRVADVVQLHLRVFRFISRIEKLFTELYFIELVGYTMDICVVGYYLLMEWHDSEMIGFMTYCILLVSFSFNIFIPCYIGELLTVECKKVGLAAYMISWYRLPDKKAMCMVIIIAASESSPKLTAGKFMDLSLITFCSVIKSSMVYLNLLRTIPM